MSLPAMKSLRTCSLLLACAGFLTLGGAAFAAADPAQPAPAGQLVPVTPKDADWAAKARAVYPTDKCLVSDEKLGADMGKPVEFIYRESGKPDRLVTFCCKDCTKDFAKDPAKYLQALDAAAAAKAKNGK